MDVRGRVAVITGASRGLGAGMAKEFHDRGMALALCARGDSALPDGDRVLTARLDVTDEAALDQFATRAFDRFGHVDLWINNAGVLEPIDALRDLEAAAFRHALDVNITGVFLGTRAYVRKLRAGDRPGVLVNISSGAAQSPYAGWAAYCATKAAVDLLTGTVALEEREHGLVRAHAVAPGVIDTDMQALIRSCTPERFPAVDKFVRMKEHGTFSSVGFVAREMLTLAFGPTPPSDTVIRFPPEH